MSADTVCRVCLVNNLNLYGVRNELQNVYEIITRQKFNKVGYPVSMCYICLSVLGKCHRFMETARDADRMLTQWTEQKNKIGVAKPLGSFSITNATLMSIENAQISFEHDIKTEKVDLAEQYPFDVQTENTGCYNVGIERSDVDEPADYSTMLVVSSTGTMHNDTTQVSDDKQTVPLFSTNMDNEWSRLDMISQHNNDNSQTCQITEIKSEIETNEETQQLSAPEIPKDIHIKIEFDETHKGDEDDVCHPEHSNINFNTKPEVLKSEYTDKGKRLHNCDLCDKSCASAAGLKRHFLLKHPTTKILKKLHRTFSCSICSFKFTRQSDLTRHTITHTGEKPFSCSICEYKCTLKSELLLHIKTHTGEKPYACDICHYKCTKQSILTVHVRTHTGEKPFSCNICDYKCTQKSTLTQHIKTHTGEKPFSCDICNYKCLGKQRLADHMRTHTRKKPFSCDICLYKCAQKSTLTQHIRTHTGEKPFSCDICDYKCIGRQHLSSHMRTHTGEMPFSCDICSYKCTQKSILTEHIRTHTGEKPFCCDICDYKCTGKQRLVDHMKTHTGEKPFSCDLCHYKSSRKSSLTRHIRTHTGEKPIACDLCDYKCAWKTNLRKHFLRKHKQM